MHRELAVQSARGVSRRGSWKGLEGLHAMQGRRLWGGDRMVRAALREKVLLLCAEWMGERQAGGPDTSMGCYEKLN